MKKTNDLRRKSLNLPLAETGSSNALKKLRRDNHLLLKRLRQLKAGPFGIWNLFRKTNDK
ncbi:hypothetical protein [Oceanobacillus picturae]|uniref:hypothetical protein n=1 Tax=Oceanobacillus picturae TaxID=171693 RepID=UPI000561079C|nr:hypothetical protein [Oceanobacillus picturae]